MAAADPTGWRRDLSVSNGKIGDAQRLLGEWAEATEAYRRAMTLNQQLLKESPSDQRLQREISYEHILIGVTLKQQGRLQEALSEYQAYLSGIRTLAQADPKNMTLQHDLGAGYDRIGDLLLENGEMKSAIDAYQASLNIAQLLASRDPVNVRWRRDLWVSLQQLAIAQERARSSEAGVWWQRALAQLEGMRSRGMPTLPGDEGLLQQMRQRVRQSGAPASE